MLAMFAAMVAACTPGEAPSSATGRGSSALTSEQEAAPGAVRRLGLPPDYERARIADEAARQYGATHPAAPRATPSVTQVAEGERTEEGGIPLGRLLIEPDLTLGSGLLIADVSFLAPGVPDDYALDPSGRYQVHTQRFRVRLHGAARSPGLTTPEGEFDLFAERDFRPTGDGSGEAPRMLVVINDRLMRPGFNLVAVSPVSGDAGLLRAAALGAAEGTSTTELMRTLRERADRLAASRAGQGG